MPALGAVLCRTTDGWTAADVDLDRADDLDGLAALAADCAAEEGGDEGPAVLLIEQVDEFFAVVRVEPEEDPRVFVSEATTALRHALGEMLLPAPDSGAAGPTASPGIPLLGLRTGTSPGADPVAAEAATDEVDAAGDGLRDVGAAVGGEEEIHAGAEPPRPAGPAGDAALLADLGLPAPRLLAIAADRRLAPADALLQVAEGVGGGDALEAVR